MPKGLPQRDPKQCWTPEMGVTANLVPWVTEKWKEVAREKGGWYFLSAHRTAVYFTFPKGHNYFPEKKFK